MVISSAFIVLCNSNDEIIVTTRPYDATADLGLPGGKIDFGETVEQGVLRELTEEGVGHDLTPDDIELVCVIPVKGKNVAWYMPKAGKSYNFVLLDDYIEKSRGIKAIVMHCSEPGLDKYGNDIAIPLAISKSSKNCTFKKD